MFSRCFLTNIRSKQGSLARPAFRRLPFLTESFFAGIFRAARSCVCISIMNTQAQMMAQLGCVPLPVTVDKGLTTYIIITMLEKGIQPNHHHQLLQCYSRGIGLYPRHKLCWEVLARLNCTPRGCPLHSCRLK